MSQNKQLMEFPCNFDIKIFGNATTNLEEIVLPIITKHNGDVKEGGVSTKSSKNNKYISITVSFKATSKEQLDNIYREVTEHPEVVMAL